MLINPKSSMLCHLFCYCSKPKEACVPETHPGTSWYVWPFLNPWPTLQCANELISETATLRNIPLNCMSECTMKQIRHLSSHICWRSWIYFPIAALTPTCSTFSATALLSSWFCLRSLVCLMCSYLHFQSGTQAQEMTPNHIRFASSSGITSGSVFSCVVVVFYSPHPHWEPLSYHCYVVMVSCGNRSRRLKSKHALYIKGLYVFRYYINAVILRWYYCHLHDLTVKPVASYPVTRFALHSIPLNTVKWEYTTSFT